MRYRNTKSYALAAFLFYGCLLQAQASRLEKSTGDSVFYVGDVIRCPLIIFYLDGGKGCFNREAGIYDSLKVIANFIRKHDLVVEVANHTDYRNDERYNLKLSGMRARSIVEYLIKEEGIDSSMVHAKGYGETAPRIIQKDVTLPSGKMLHKGTRLTREWIDKNVPRLVNKDDYETVMQLNRRTELRVTGIR